MYKRLIIMMMLLTACTGAPTTTPSPPTATLRPLPSPTFTPAAPTLAPTATTPPSPTPNVAASPTPIIYVVQNGDTLIGIATRFQVTLEALEALNLGLDPANLRPGQTIAIPPGAVDAAAPVTVATLAPLSVTANPFTCYPTPAASVICMSEFVNTTTEPIVNLAVQATLVNEDNSPGPNGTAYSPLDLIPPGAAVPLAIVFPAPAVGRQANAVVTQADSGVGLADRFVLLTMSEVNGSPADGGFTVSGTLVNPTAADLHSISVIATLYNSSGSVAGYRKIIIAEPLAAGASLSFSITLPGTAEVNRWTVIAQGRVR